MNRYIIDEAEILHLLKTGQLKEVFEFNPSWGRQATKEEWQTGLVSPILGKRDPKPGHVLCVGRDVGYVPFDYEKDFIFKIEGLSPEKEAYLVLPGYMVDLLKEPIPTMTVVRPGQWAPFKNIAEQYAVQVMRQFSCDRGTTRHSGNPGNWLIYNQSLHDWFPCTDKEFRLTYKFK